MLLIKIINVILEYLQSMYYIIDSLASSYMWKYLIAFFALYA